MRPKKNLAADLVASGSVVLDLSSFLRFGISVLLRVWGVEFSWVGCHGTGILRLAKGLCWTDLRLVRYNKKKYW